MVNPDYDSKDYEQPNNNIDNNANNNCSTYKIFPYFFKYIQNDSTKKNIA